MAKQVTRASKLPDAFVILLSKMGENGETSRQTRREKNSKTRRPKRQETRKRKLSMDRVGIFVADYVEHKYPKIYAEAVHFNKTLRQKYPQKLDLKKTTDYRHWITQQEDKNPLHGQFNNFQLKVHLLDNDSIQKKATNTTIEIMDEGDTKNSVLESAMCETLNEDTIEPPLEEFISAELYDQVLNELRADPDLARIMASIEEQIQHEELDIGMNIDIDIDDRLEKELQ